MVWCFLGWQMKKTIALTGATGFVGSHLLNKLVSNGFHVNALTRSDQPPMENVTWIKGDFGNAEALMKVTKKADTIINVAGLIKAKNITEFIDTNANAISNLLTIIERANNKPHFIQISSLAAKIPEISDYAFSKKLGETILIENNIKLNWTIVRPPGIYGPGDKETLKIFKMINWRIGLFPDNRNNRVSWISVTDLTDAILKMIGQNKYYGEIFEIDDGTKAGYSHLDFLNITGGILGVEPIKITVPKNILKTISYLNMFFGKLFGYPPMISMKKVDELCHPLWVCNPDDNSKISGWVPQYQLKEGLTQALEWYKKNKCI
jgi:2-alkyl-3-oxoalkanoate reductase